jgi:non-ribosomal peptide synthetase component F
MIVSRRFKSAAPSKDIVFGISLSTRCPELERSDEIIGLLINTIPLRIQFDGVRLEFHVAINHFFNIIR